MSTEAELSAPFTLTVNGTGFVPPANSGGMGSYAGVWYNDTYYSRPFTYVSSTQIQISLTAADVAYPGAIQILVQNSNGTCLVNATAQLSVSPALTPTVSALTPASATAGGVAMTLTVNGAGFVPGAAALWNGTALATSFVNLTQLTASIPAALIATKGTVAVTVINPDGKTSIPVAFNIVAPPPAATPVFLPAAGTYTAAQIVTISDSSAGATVYYTTNGTTPTASSTIYSGPITITLTQTLEAIATAGGYSASVVATATYTIAPTAATPTFSVAPGAYTSAQTVTISDSTAAATIYYSTNGTTPTTNSTLYSGAITVGSSETIEAIAVASGYSQSAVATAAYTITPPAATPTFNVAAGTYASAQTISISDAIPGATIYYTANGTSPTTSSAQYTGPITVTSTETLKAIGVATGYSQSAVATATYTILLLAATPTFSLAPGTYTSVQTVMISDATSGATIYYTTDGTTPTTNSTVYNGAISVGVTETVEASAIASGYSMSALASAMYTISLPPDFQMLGSPSALTIVVGHTGSATFTVTPQNGFNSQVSFSCSGLPSETVCSFSPASVTPSGAPVTSTLTISTTAASAAMRVPIAPSQPRIYALLVPSFALVFGIAVRRRRALLGSQLFSLLILLAVASGLTACGGKGMESVSVGNPFQLPTS